MADRSWKVPDGPDVVAPHFRLVAASPAGAWPRLALLSLRIQVGRQSPWELTGLP